MSEADTNDPLPASQKEPPVEGPEVHHPHKHHGQTCYCSVFDECWQVQGIWGEPEPLKECARDEPREFTPNS